MTSKEQLIINNNTDKQIRANILLVEDSPSQALRFSQMLENNGFCVHWSPNGNEGLRSVKQQDFDLILLDVELPDINGFDICKQLKANPETASTPVIMLTTRDKAKDVLVGLNNGAVDYIPKDDFAELVLLETIRQMGLKSV